MMFSFFVPSLRTYKKGPRANQEKKSTPVLGKDRERRIPEKEERNTRWISWR
jgi:hypothetical protein